MGTDIHLIQKLLGHNDIKITWVNADGIKIMGQLGAADIGQYILSFRY